MQAGSCYINRDLTAAISIAGGFLSGADQEKYWLDEGVKFAGFYAIGRRLSPKRLVSRFLESRTGCPVELADIGAGDDVLDVGCGASVHIQTFAPRCRSIVGIDYSAGMIMEATNTLCGGRPGCCRLSVADAHHIPFRKERFTRVISMGVLGHVASP
jgi:2-polyprenyl-3-methyl-5-hydroxy-6-metoxy-1,4-benzoquinol methylase